MVINANHFSSQWTQNSSNMPDLGQQSQMAFNRGNEVYSVGAYPVSTGESIVETQQSNTSYHNSPQNRRRTIDTSLGNSMNVINRSSRPQSIEQGAINFNYYQQQPVNQQYQEGFGDCFEIGSHENAFVIPFSYLDDYHKLQNVNFEIFYLHTK